MKIAITSKQPSLDSDVDPRLGRCPYLILIDLDTNEHEILENPNISAASGAGIQTARLLSEKGVKAVLTGNCGPNAHQTLTAAGIQVLAGVSGAIPNAIEQFKANSFTPASKPTVEAHAGMKANLPAETTSSPQTDPPLTSDNDIDSGDDMGGRRGMSGGRGRGGGGSGGRGMGGGGGMGGGRGRGACGGGGGRGMGGGQGRKRG